LCHDGCQRVAYGAAHAGKVNDADVDPPGSESIIDHRQQLAAGGMDAFEIWKDGLGVVFRRRLHEHLAIPNDLIERGSQGVP
jgi:hypothetical protein